MKKQKLIALVYGPEDQTKILNWVSSISHTYEITDWSSQLSLPIQAAVANYCSAEGIDGLVIDDHNHYDEIVMNQLARILRIYKISLYSTTHGPLPVIAIKSAPSNCKAISAFPKLDKKANFTQPTRVAV